MTRPRAAHLALALTMVVAAGLRVHRLDLDLPLVFEEATPMRVALQMWRENGSLDPNPHFFNYPSLVIYANLAVQALVLCAGRALGTYTDVPAALAAWELDPTPIVIGGRLVSLIAALAAIWGVHRIGRELGGASLGVLGAAVLTLSPWHLGVSRSILVDGPLLAFSAAALVECVRLANHSSGRVAARAGLLVGLAASAKYPGALAAIAVAAGLATGLRAAGRPLASLVTSAPPWIAAACAIGAFVITSPFVVLDPAAFAEHLGIEREHMAAGHFGLDPSGATGAYARAIGNLTGGWGLPFLVLGLAVIARRLREERGWWPLLVHAVLVLALISTWSMYGAHYLSPVVPLLSVLTGAGLLASLHWCRSLAPAIARVAAVVLAVVAIGVALDAITRQTRPSTRALTREWLVENLEPGDIVAYEHRTVDIDRDPLLAARARAVRMPLNTLDPARSRPYYDTRWFQGFDAIVVSDDVASRYRRDPERFLGQNAFYDSLSLRWVLAADLRPGKGHRGAAVRVYRNPALAIEEDAPMPEALTSKLRGESGPIAARFLLGIGDAYLSRGWAIRATGAYRLATRIDPTAEPAFYNLGTLELRRGRFGDAVRALRRARELNWERSETHNNLGIALARDGRREEAIAAFRDALGVDPAHEGARLNLERLKEEDGANPGEAPSSGRTPGMPVYWLTLLHNNDAESKLLDAGRGEEGVGGIARFVAVVDRLRAEASGSTSGTPHGLVVVSSGDNTLAGPELAVSFEKGPPFYDVIGLGQVGYDALCVGNHELDFGPDVFADLLDGFRLLSNGTPPPFLTANLDVSRHPRLHAAVSEGRLAPSTVVESGGRRVGIVGATTPDLVHISCPTDLEVDQDVAAAVQREIDALSSRGIEIIVLITHLQDVRADIALLGAIRSVDIAVAGGGDEVLANEGDVLVPGDEEEVFGAYPMLATDALGDTVRVVTTRGQYRYVGRLVVGFDEHGHIVATDRDRSAPVRVVERDGFPDGIDPAPRVEGSVTRPVREALAGLATVTVGRTDVPLEGRRRHVRTRQTNLGTLVADAILWAARREAAPLGREWPRIAIHNGGGVRNDTLVPPGDLSELDTFRIVPFANFVTIAEGVSASRLLAILENGVSQLPGADGRYPQVAGFHFELGPVREGGQVRSIVLDDGTRLVEEGRPVAGAPSVALATTDFLCRGGDRYPLADVDCGSVGVTVQQAVTRYVRQQLGGRISAPRYAPLGPDGSAGR